MPIPEKIKIDIWEKVWENFGVYGILPLMFLIFHMFFREKSIQFWKDMWHALRALLRILLWPLRIIYGKAKQKWQDWQENRRQRRTIAEFDRLHPDQKDKYTEYGKIWIMNRRDFFETLSSLGKMPPSK